jgi:hypothetical protein
MFYDCKKLSNISVKFNTWDLSKYITGNWVKNVSSTGTFKCVEALPAQFGVNYIPNGWTVVRVADDGTIIDTRSSLVIDEESVLYDENKEYMIATEF